MDMEGFKFKKEKGLDADIQSEPNEEGSFDVVHLKEQMEHEVASIRSTNPEAAAALDIIETDRMPRGIKEKMKVYLNDIQPEFNWELYFELKEEPTFH